MSAEGQSLADAFAGMAEWKKYVIVGGAAASVALLLNNLQKADGRKPVEASREIDVEQAEAPGAKHRAVETAAAKPVPPAAHVDEPVDIRACQRQAVEKYIKDVDGSFKSKVDESDVNALGELSKYLAFKQEFGTAFAARPDVDEGVLLKVTDWRLLTPKDYDRTCFHIEVDIKGTNIEHLCNGAAGKALSVYATNDAEKVREFMKEMKLNPNEIVSCEDVVTVDDASVALTTVEKMLTQYLDIFGKPTREFLKKLHPFAVDIQEKVAIAELTLERKTEEFQEYQAQAYTFADYLTKWKSLKIPAQKYFELLPTVKQRVYSICSSSDLHPGKCQLLVVREDWQAKGGSTKYGLCSSFLTFAREGSYCVGHSTHSVMNLPEDKSIPIFMAGLGTGLAPFRAFVEQRKYQKNQGHKVGPMTLFFGGRYSKSEYYYRDEFEGYEAEGLVKCCNAWSRDQAQKVYVQHKLLEEADSIWEHLGKSGSKGHFFLCGSKQPEKDVFAAIIQVMKTKGGMSDTQAQKKMEELQQSGRYVTEVY